MDEQPRAPIVSFWKVVVLGLCAMEVGPNLALSAGFQLHVSGRLSWLVIALASGIAMLIAVAISLFASRFVATGSILSYVRIALPRWAVCVTATCLLLGYILGATSSVMGAALYFSTILLQLGMPWATTPTALSMLMLIVSAAAGFFAYRGVDVSAKVALILGLVCIPVAIGVTLAAAFSNGFQIQDELSVRGTSWLDMGRGIFVALGFFVGFDGIGALASETNNPTRNVARVFRWTLGLTAVTVAAAALLQTPILLAHSDAIDAGESPTSILARAAGLSGLNVASDLLLFMATVAGLIAWLNFAALIVATAGSDRFLPRALADIHPVHKTPYKSVIFLSVIGWLIPVLLEVAARTPVLTSIVYLNNMSVVFWLVPYALVCIAAMIFLKRSGRSLGPTSLAATLGMLALVGVMAIQAISPADPMSAMMERLSLVLIVVGSGVFLLGGQAKQLAG
jgi:basic amino acid/polyamine antiporter, APA family